MNRIEDTVNQLKEKKENLHLILIEVQSILM